VTGDELSKAEEANKKCNDPRLSAAIALNQAWLLRSKDPPGVLARLDEIEKSAGESLETLLLRGYLASDRGDLVKAEEYLTRAEAKEPPDVDWPWVVARARAELAELRGELFDDLLAEYYYRRATAIVAGLRSPNRERSAHLVSSHRGPYDGLIGLLARNGRWPDVLAVIL
jgi:hypothetical protein